MIVFRTITEKQKTRKTNTTTCFSPWLAWLDKKYALQWGKRHGKKYIISLNIDPMKLHSWQGHKNLAVGSKYNTEIIQWEVI
jgi:hypothetical protein